VHDSNELQLPHQLKRTTCPQSGLYKLKELLWNLLDKCLREDVAGINQDANTRLQEQNSKVRMPLLAADERTCIGDGTMEGIIRVMSQQPHRVYLVLEEFATLIGMAGGQ
jgi:hypothetical protein